MKILKNLIDAQRRRAKENSQRQKYDRAKIKIKECEKILEKIRCEENKGVLKKLFVSMPGVNRVTVETSYDSNLRFSMDDGFDDFFYEKTRGGWRETFIAAGESVIKRIKQTNGILDYGFEDVSHLVAFANPGDESLPILKCVCGQNFDLWEFSISIYEETARDCPNCGRLLYFRNSVHVFAREV